MILTRKMLGKMTCSHPDCTDDHSTLFFRSTCHPDEGTWAAYEKATGLLTLICCACDKPLAVLQIADHAQTVLEMH
jgi:hypothetical protein